MTDHFDDYGYICSRPGVVPRADGVGHCHVNEGQRESLPVARTVGPSTEGAQRDVRTLRQMAARMLDGDPIVDADRVELANDLVDMANRWAPSARCASSNAGDQR